MSQKISLTAKLDQRLTMNQQLRQAISLLQYNTIELNDMIKAQLESNPLLEVSNPYDEEAKEPAQNEPIDFSQYQPRSVHHEFKDDNYLENYARPTSLREHLLQQTLLCQFSAQEQLYAEAIIDSLDETGRLSLSLSDLLPQEEPAAILEKIEQVLSVIQTFDPPGVAARDVRESLLIQLNLLPEKGMAWELAFKIIHDHFGLLTPNYIKKIMKALNVDQKTYHDALALIKKLRLNPVAHFHDQNDINIEPELYVKKIKNRWHVFLNDSLLTQVKVNQHYQQLLKQNKQHASYQSLNQELQQAQWLIKGLKRRNETLLAVARHIIERQAEFLEGGATYLKPMNINEVAYALDIHESTVSRVTTGKYMVTPLGVFELKYFFPSHVTTKTGETCSAIAVKALIKEMIQREISNHIYSDEDIAQALKEKGINIARRTVAKYREALGILPSYRRMGREEEALA